MKMYLTIVVLLCMASGQAIAQDTTTEIGLDSALYKKILNRQFSILITGQSKHSIGNFASLDTKDGEVSFAGSVISRNGSVLTLRASRAVSDGFFKVFTNCKLNTKVALDITGKPQSYHPNRDPANDQHEVSGALDAGVSSRITLASFSNC
jgi:hypothetical protein